MARKSVDNKKLINQFVDKCSYDFYSSDYCRETAMNDIVSDLLKKGMVFTNDINRIIFMHWEFAITYGILIKYGFKITNNLIIFKFLADLSNILRGESRFIGRKYKVITANKLIENENVKKYIDLDEVIITDEDINDYYNLSCFKNNNNKIDNESIIINNILDNKYFTNFKYDLIKWPKITLKLNKYLELENNKRKINQEKKLIEEEEKLKNIENQRKIVSDILFDRKKINNSTNQYLMNKFFKKIDDTNIWDDDNYDYVDNLLTGLLYDGMTFTKKFNRFYFIHNNFSITFGIFISYGFELTNNIIIFDFLSNLCKNLHYNKFINGSLYRLNAISNLIKNEKVKKYINLEEVIITDKDIDDYHKISCYNNFEETNHKIIYDLLKDEYFYEFKAIDKFEKNNNIKWPKITLKLDKYLELENEIRKK
jgi:hypothetical protein